MKILIFLFRIFVINSIIIFNAGIFKVCTGTSLILCGITLLSLKLYRNFKGKPTRGEEQVGKIKAEIVWRKWPLNNNIRSPDQSEAKGAQERYKRRENIENSTYTRKYNILIPEEQLVYLEQQNKDSDLIARFGLGIEKGWESYLQREDERKCRMCGNGEETLEHLNKHCVPGSIQDP